jgi:hypothetical protein
LVDADRISKKRPRRSQILCTNFLECRARRVIEQWFPKPEARVFQRHDLFDHDLRLSKLGNHAPYIEGLRRGCCGTCCPPSVGKEPATIDGRPRWRFLIPSPSCQHIRSPARGAWRRRLGYQLRHPTTAGSCLPTTTGSGRPPAPESQMHSLRCAWRGQAGRRSRHPTAAGSCVRFGVRAGCRGDLKLSPLHPGDQTSSAIAEVGQQHASDQDAQLQSVAGGTCRARCSNLAGMPCLEWSSERDCRLKRERWRRHWVATDKPTAPAHASLETLHDDQS